MKIFSQKLRLEMDTQLEFIQAQTEIPLEYAERSVKAMVQILERLKTFSVTYTFKDKEQEIEFFREIKPAFVHKLIFFNKLYNIESAKSNGSRKSKLRYYSKEVMRLQQHFNDNREFYKYWRTGNNSLDSEYFLRGNYNLKLTLDSHFFQADSRFSTSHDYKVAQVMANERINEYLKKEIKKLKTKSGRQAGNSNAKIQKWTGSNAALVELIYALHYAGVINNGNSGLKEIAVLLETALNINLGQFNRTFVEIRSRKSERAKFLSQLREKLLRKMDEADN